MSSLLKIENIARPSVGLFYLVPCVLMPVMLVNRPVWLPIIGPWHEDKDIGVASYHFHFDLRFLSRHLFDQWQGVRAMARVQPRLGHLKSEVLSGSERDRDNPCPFSYRRRKMLREMPDFPRNDAGEKEFAGVKMKCLVCPHRGMPLKHLPVGPDGTVVCNGHGLKWHATTGALVPR